MNRKSDAPDLELPFAPRFPTLLAFGLFCVWVLLLALPMFQGRFLVNDMSDQMWTGVPFRWFGAQEWRRTGEIALWNPFMFGGLPFVGAMHGDIFYPTAWLRLVLPIDVAMNLGFAVHYVLAGFFAYLFFRSLKIGWTGSLVGGLAYQLCGVMASLVRPGHDGKLFASALMPLVLLGLVMGIRQRRLEGYGVLALAVGLGLVSPHIQLMQYTLIFAGLFTLYLAFRDEERPETAAGRWRAVGLALAAVVLGFGVGMIQLWPFISYLPHAARYAGAQGWEYATSYAMPWTHVVDWLVPDFTGSGAAYWGENPLKLHTEYLGAATLVLASIGAGDAKRRRLLWFMGGVWLLFVLVALGAHTPFYRLWYALVPGVKSTRAPGMAFFIPSFVTALAAALGVARLERGEGKRALVPWLAVAGALLLLGVSGGLAQLAASWAGSDQARAVARQDANVISLSSIKSVIVLLSASGLAWAALSGRVRKLGLALGLFAIVGADLFATGRQFWEYSPRAAQLYADDEVTSRIARTRYPYRVLDVGVYPTAFLMGKRIPSVLGHHGNELHAYDQLLGGKNVWANLGSPQLWDLLAVRYLLLANPQQIPGFHTVLASARTGQGQTAVLLEADSVPPYARVVPAAAKLPADRIVPTVLDRRLDVSRVVLLDEDAPVSLPRLDTLPPRSASRAAVTAWEPGAMTVRIDPVPDRDSYLLVSENWYPDWRAEVDGRPALALRGDHTFITVPISAGAREVRLSVHSAAYVRGAAASMASLALILAWLVVPAFKRRRSA